jgi:3-oxoacyl-[acyl-carrier-protein] synthase II
VFEDSPPVTAVKSMLGHSLGAAGAIEAVTAVQSIAENTIPPTINLESKDDDCPVPVVTDPRETTVDTVLSNSAGFGGTNGTLVFRDAHR